MWIMENNVDKYVIRGIKKLRSLTRTKIRLAEEAGTERVRPEPLPLVKFLSNKEIRTVAEAKEHREELGTEYEDSKKAARDVLQLMDIIEGVKYDFEPKELMINLTEKDLKAIEKGATERSEKVTLLIMSDAVEEGQDLYIGRGCPKGATYLSGVPTSLAGFLDFAFHSDYLSEGEGLKNVRVVLGHNTLIMNAICFALGEMGAEGISNVPDEIEGEAEE